MARGNYEWSTDFMCPRLFQNIFEEGMEKGVEFGSSQSNSKVLEQNEEETEDTSENSPCRWSIGNRFICTGHDPLAVDKVCRIVTISLSYKCKYCIREYLEFKGQSQVCVHSIRKADWFC